MTVKGPWTGVNLSDVSPLFVRAPGAALKYDGAPNRSRGTVLLSYELAAAAYTMDPERWSQAGWQDFSMLVNRQLMTGPMLNAAGTPLNDLTRTTLQTLARIKKSALNPIGQVMGLRQSGEETASLKAIVMLRPQGGLMTVAIGFMGTGKQLGDWMPNLRMTAVDGLHEGFLQLTEEFEGFLDQIAFPCAAGALNRSALSLQQIVEEMKAPGSRFRLWMSGHSQGAAVMQVFVDRLLRAGVRPEYLCGFGFASPTVAYPGRPLPADGYPITHIMNADDLVPRVGAWKHLGRCLAFAPNTDDRKRMYGTMANDPCSCTMHRLLLRARTAPDALMNGMAILRVMRDQAGFSFQGVLGDTEFKPLADLLNAGEDGLKKLLDTLYSRLESGYLAVSGEPCVPQTTLVRLTHLWQLLFRQYGSAAWLRALRAAALLPHRMYRSPEGGTASYLYIVTEGRLRLDPVQAFSPCLTGLSFGEVKAHPAVRTASPGASAGRTRCVSARKETQSAEPANTEPAADVPARPSPSDASRYAAALRLLAASRARKKRR